MSKIKERGFIAHPFEVRGLLDGRTTLLVRPVKPQPFCNKVGQWLWEPKPGIIHAFHPELSEERYPTAKLQHASPYGRRSGRLWVRESYQVPSSLDAMSPAAIAHACNEAGYRIPWAAVRYKADGAKVNGDTLRDFGDGKWGKLRPSPQMPRWASRILLEITDVRVLRLQEISETYAVATGLKGLTKDGKLVKYGVPESDGWPGREQPGAWPWDEWKTGPVDAYRKPWDSINAACGHSWESNPWVWLTSIRRVEEVNP